MSIEKGLVNLASYNSGMKKSMMDKMFFMDKVDAHVFVDYGCANGMLIQFLYNLFPEFEYYGFDISEKMIEEAKVNNPNLEGNFFTDWKKLQNKLINSHGGQKTAVILSSVIHEVYSYGTIDDVEYFWNRVFGDGFDYIVLREMMPSITMNKVADINDISKIYRKADRKLLYDFQQTWGSVENNKNLIHYILKYQYGDNWDREVKENYLPINREQLLSMIPDNYDVVFHEHYILPYLLNQVLKDFGVEIKDNTHLKLILKRNKL